MPNGISCAYFALKNLKVGKANKDVFREGIAGCQTVRTVDEAIKFKGVPPISKAANGFINSAAKFARKIVYPLIIASGVYNTVRADDKVKTGAMQASGIATMYAFETVAEKALKNISNKLLNIPFVKNHNAARFGVYVAKGLAFVAASLAGYDIGSNGAENIVNKIRERKTKNINNPEVKEETKNSDEMGNVLNEFVFSDMD